MLQQIHPGYEIPAGEVLPLDQHFFLLTFIGLFPILSLISAARRWPGAGER
jgi:hypothetical protein